MGFEWDLNQHCCMFIWFKSFNYQHVSYQRLLRGVSAGKPWENHIHYELCLNGGAKNRV